MDDQRRGPCRVWVHEHCFEPHDGGTLCTDRVTYALSFDPLVHRLLVRPDLERIFAFRRAMLHALFGGPASAPPPERSE